jgi:hypothetical protein
VKALLALNALVAPPAKVPVLMLVAPE